MMNFYSVQEDENKWKQKYSAGTAVSNLVEFWKCFRTALGELVRFACRSYLGLCENSLPNTEINKSKTEYAIYETDYNRN